MQRLFSLFSKNDNSSKAERTESMRKDVYSGSNQRIWETESRKVEKTIQDMFESKANLLSIYEFARKERHRIAIDLQHEPAEKFGQLRVTGQDSREECDVYKPNSIAGNNTKDTSTFTAIATIALSQKDKFAFIHPLFEDGYALHSTAIWLSASKEKPIFAYASKTDYPTKPSLEIYSSYDLANPSDANPLPLPTMIKVSWQRMDPSIYEANLIKCDDVIKAYRPLEGEDALFQLGLLAYDLSRLTLLTRGSAAVNGWVIRGLAAAKGMELGVLRVNGLPFDIYAELQLDRNQYAKDFVASLAKEYNLFPTQTLKLK